VLSGRGLCDELITRPEESYRLCCVVCDLETSRMGAPYIYDISHLRVNRTQSRAVTGLLTGHNTLRRHLYLLGLLDSPLCRKCGVREETSAHILCECEALASLRHAYLGSVFLEPKDIQSVSLGAIWSFSKASGPPWLDMGHKGPVYKGLGASGPRDPEPLTHSYSCCHYFIKGGRIPSPTAYKTGWASVLG